MNYYLVLHGYYLYSLTFSYTISYAIMEELPKHIKNSAKKATESLLPLKSKETYEKEYIAFKEWRLSNKLAVINETVLLAYFQQLVSFIY